MNTNADELLKEFEDTITQEEPQRPPESVLSESDQYLRHTCFELGLKLLEKKRKIYVENMVEYCVGLAGLEFGVKLSRRLTELFPKVDNFQRLLTDCPDHSSDARDITRWLQRVLAEDRKLYDLGIKQIILKLRRDLRAIDVTQESFFYKKLCELKKTLELSENEGKVVTYLFLIETNELVYDQIFRDWDIRQLDKTKDIYETLLGVSIPEVRQLLSKNGRLWQIGIIVPARRGSRDIEINQSLVSYLTGMDTATLTDKFFIEHRDLTGVLPVSAHLSDALNTELVLNLLTREGGTNILFYGVPGTGKTEYAKTLAKELGKTLFEIRASEEDNDSKAAAVGYRKIALNAALKLLDPAKTIILIDEADTLLNLADSEHFSESHTDKSWMNMLLEKVKAKIIWITNKSDRIDSSTRRRFNFIQEFKNLNFEKRLRIWENQCAIHEIGFLPKETLEGLAGKFTVNAGSIAIALRDLKGMLEERLVSPEKAPEILEKMVKSHQSFIGGNTLQLKPMEISYRPEFLNTSISPDILLKSLQRFRTTKLIHNYNLLFYGVPGTGKTELAKYLAHELGMQLEIKRTSDLLSMFVGESEKNIAKAFQQAEENDAILLLDECDSLFLKREKAERSYEISRTNELLVAMENFQGILICSTNFKEGLDEAAGRRFTQKVLFDYLRTSDLPEFFENFFGAKLTHEDRELLCDLSFLTPGDFNVVKRRMIVEGFETNGELIACLREEVGHKKVAQKRIGF